MQKLLYTVPEALTLLSLGRTKFYEEVHRGRISIVKAGGKTLVPDDSLHGYVATLVDESKAAA
jgi:excisionase family DNA binding protein